MSNIYLTEPPTQGKVLIHTTAGDIDIELWSKEAPLACRNFVQLALEGYYDNTPISRVIKDFMVQAGDPTGTGTGGSSIWGRPFKDEIHGRIKFNHRGQVAMANENKPNSNHSQFFITLGECEWINRKHTIFGKVTGNTIFNVMKLGEVEVDRNDKPVDPIMITKVEVLWNPFDDIVPRLLTVEPKSSIISDPNKERKKARKGSKDLKLLSFGDDDEVEAAELNTSLPGKMISAHDVQQEKLSAEVDQELLEITRLERLRELEEKKTRRAAENTKQTSDRCQEASKDQGDDEIVETDFEAKMLQQIREKRKKMGKPAVTSTSSTGPALLERNREVDEEDDGLSSLGSSGNADPDNVSSKEFNRLKKEMLRSRKAVKVMTGQDAEQHRNDVAFQELVTPLEQRRQRYIKRKREHGNREDETLMRLKQFSEKLQKTKKEVNVVETERKSRFSETYSGQVTEQADDEEGALKDGNDAHWHLGKLKFRKHIDDLYRMGGDGRSLDDYKVEDAWRK